MADVLRRVISVGGVAVLALCASAAGSFPAALARAAQTQVPRRAAAAYSPSPGYLNYLQSVHALSPTNAWAVGDWCKSNCYGASARFHPLILHWNGQAWSKAVAPSPGSFPLLYSVTATSSSDAWTVGEGDYGGLMLHWNGTAWSLVDIAKIDPNVGGFAGVSASSADDVWAVGYYNSRTVALHWNGTAWSHIRTPSPNKAGDLLNGVSDLTPSDAWAVGTYCASGCSSSTPVNRSLVLRWNGTAWSRMTFPFKRAAELDTVDAVSATDVWAIGLTASRNTLVFHWNGSTWSQVAVPKDSFPGGISFISPTNGWAVGGPLFLHWTGTAWKKDPVTAPNGSFFDGASMDKAKDAWAVGSRCVTKCSSQHPGWDTITMHWNGSTWVRK